MDRNEQIDRFITNEMEPEERREFCRELEVNRELKEEVALRALLIEAATIESEKEALQAIKKQPARTVNKPLKMWNSIIAAAIIAGALFLIGNGYRYTPAEVYNQCYEAPLIESSRGTGETTRQLHEAITNLEQSNGEKAILLLDSNVLHSAYSEEAEWLLLCAYLQTGNREQAEAAALSIRQKKGVFAPQADEVLKQLKEKRWF